MGNDELRDILSEFIEWARDCGEDVFFIFDDPDAAIQSFLHEKESSEE